MRGHIRKAQCNTPVMSLWGARCTSDKRNSFNRWYRGRFRGRICPWFCRRVRHSGRGALRRCRRECCCRVVREQGNFSPMPFASDLATTGDERKIRCSGAWLFSARVPLSRLLGVRPDSLRTHHLFLSSLTCVCQFPFHKKSCPRKPASHSLTVMVRGGHVFRVAWLSDRRGDEGKS